MSDYADASLIVSAFTDEPGAEVAERWLSSGVRGTLLYSPWSLVEIASALFVKERTKYLKPTDRPKLYALIMTELARSAVSVPIDASHYLTASDYLNRSTVALRAGDALHLAIAATAHATLWTLDRRMAEAGIALGLDARLLA